MLRVDVEDKKVGITYLVVVSPGMTFGDLAKDFASVPATLEIQGVNTTEGEIRIVGHEYVPAYELITRKKEVDEHR